jgi:AcrR family transcriptional regulator
MQEDTMTRKEKLLESALTLFAEKGYDGTGVDQIAELAGITGPSLYRHFKSKEEILNALIDAAEERYNEYFGAAITIDSIPTSKKDFIKKTMDRIKFAMTDPMIRKIRIFLVQEQFRNERLAEITSRHQVHGLVGLYEKIIGFMMKQGLFMEDDPAILALELISPVTLMIAMADRQPEYEKKALKTVEKLVRHFCDKYMV